MQKKAKELCWLKIYFVKIRNLIKRLINQLNLKKIKREDSRKIPLKIENCWGNLSNLFFSF